MIAKIEARVPAVVDLAAGAPALLFLSRGLLWSCAHHMLRVYAGSRLLRRCFQEAQSALLKGPRGWLLPGVAINLKQVGWKYPPITVDELEIRLQLNLIIKMSEHPFARIHAELKEAVYAESAPLSPFLSEWFQNCAYTSLMRLVGVGVRHNYLEIRDDGRIRIRSSIRSIQTSRAAFGKLVSLWLSQPGEALELGPSIIWRWLRLKFLRLWGESWDSALWLGRVIDYLRKMSALVPLRCFNAYLRLLTGGVYLHPSDSNAVARGCLLVRGCGGQNDVEHYACSSCWKTGPIANKFPAWLNLLPPRSRQPDAAGCRGRAFVAYYVVKALNFARHLQPEDRPDHAITYVMMYR